MITKRILLSLFIVLGLCLPTFAQTSDPNSMLVYIGTYTNQKSKGIYLFRLDKNSGALSPLGLAAEIPSPSFLAIHPNRKFLYAVSEIANFSGQKTGAVSAFAINPDGKLTALNQQASGGTGPCHLSVDKDGKAVFVANYGGGSISAIPINPDGSLKPATSTIQHKGSSVNKQRQEAPHAHSINLDPAGRFVFAADLGLDKILIYRFEPENITLVPNDPPHASLTPGAGPRHFAFHPTGKFAFTNNELTSSVTAFSYDAEKGALKELQTLSTLPAETKGNSTAETQVHPSGKFVYVSNRGHDSIAIFSFDAASGKLSVVGHQSTLGRTPRNFCIDPTGQFLIAANQNSHTLTTFRINQSTGELEPIGTPVDAPSPVCVKFLPAQ